MNRTMNTVAMLAVAGVLASGATAFGAESGATNQIRSARAKGAGIASRLKELTLTGIVAQNEIKVAGKNYSVFVLITASGAKLHLPMAKTGKKAAAAPAIRLADYVGQNVKVVAMGSEQKKGDKTVVRVRTLKAIEKVAASPADAAPAKVA